MALKHELVSVERQGGGFELGIIGPDGGETSITCDVLVNSAGLLADRVAAMLGYDLDGTADTPPMRQTVNKGRYYDIVAPEKARLLRHLVYPVPDHGKGGLGVHVTIDVDGGVHLGPDTEWLDDGAELDYRADDSRRAAFHASASRYLPFLEPDDIAPGQVGYRPKLQRPGEPIADFLIWRDGRLRAPRRHRVAGADGEPRYRAMCGGTGVGRLDPCLHAAPMPSARRTTAASAPATTPAALDPL